jgi:hypothetical protein
MPTPTTYPAAAADIVDLAFILMEKAPPASFADDTPEAQDAGRHYPAALQTCLEFADWSFASRFVSLPEIALPAGLATDPRMPHLYALPGDCLRVREVGDRGTVWRIDGVQLRADHPGPLALRYTARIVNEQQLTAGFRTALATDLAARLAPRWLGTASKIDLLMRLADDRLRKAARDDRATGSQTTWHGGASEDWGSVILR